MDDRVALSYVYSVFFIYFSTSVCVFFPATQKYINRTMGSSAVPSCGVENVFFLISVCVAFWKHKDWGLCIHCLYAIVGMHSFLWLFVCVLYGSQSWGNAAFPGISRIACFHLAIKVTGGCDILLGISGIFFWGD